MSSFNVSLKVWNNGSLAAKRCDALFRRAHALFAKLNEVADLWQEARGRYGEELSAWSFGDARLPASYSGLVGRVAKVQRTRYNAAERWTLGATISDLESVARDVDKLESFVNGLAGRVSRAQAELTLFTVRKSLQAQLQQEVSRLFDTLDADVSPEDRSALEQKAAEAVEASQESRRRALLAQLHLDIQRANVAAAERQRAVEQAEQWRVRLLGLEGPEVEALDSELLQVVDRQGPLPPDMEQKVEDVVARATEASNRDYAMEVITEELQNLGYVVEDGFETASAQDPEMLLRKADMEADYHVSLRADAGGLHNRVVREGSDPGEPGAARKRTDEQMERKWCKDLAAALAAAEHRGVRGRAATLNPPGETPVPVVAPVKREHKPESTGRRKRTGRLRSRVRR